MFKMYRDFSRTSRNSDTSRDSADQSGSSNFFVDAVIIRIPHSTCIVTNFDFVAAHSGRRLELRLRCVARVVRAARVRQLNEQIASASSTSSRMMRAKRHYKHDSLEILVVESTEL